MISRIPSNAGGGGERVLWAAIAYLQRTEPNVVSAVYTGDIGVSKEEIIEKVNVISYFLSMLTPTLIVSGRLDLALCLIPQHCYSFICLPDTSLTTKHGSG